MKNKHNINCLLTRTLHSLKRSEAQFTREWAHQAKFQLKASYRITREKVARRRKVIHRQGYHSSNNCVRDPRVHVIAKLGHLWQERPLLYKLKLSWILLTRWANKNRSLINKSELNFVQSLMRQRLPSSEIVRKTASSHHKWLLNKSSQSKWQTINWVHATTMVHQALHSLIHRDRRKTRWRLHMKLKTSKWPSTRTLQM